MRLLKCLTEFYELVEPVCGEEMFSFPLIPDGYTGRFDARRIQELLDFCKKNSGYHIASCHGAYTYYNRYIPNARKYFICYGDPDPEIVCVFGTQAKMEIALEEIDSVFVRK